MENITKNEKTLIVYENTKYISKIAENGNKFQEELKEKPDLGFGYIEVQFIMDKSGHIQNSEYIPNKENAGWEVLDDVQVDKIIKFIENYKIPDEFYPTHWSNVADAIYSSFYGYMDKTLYYVIDLAEDNTPIPDNVRANRKFIKKYIPMLEDENIKDEETFNKVFILLKDAPEEVIDNATRCIKQSIPEYDLKMVLNG